MTFRPHIQFAHQYWKEILQLGDTTIDATCGNGHDTLYLCQLTVNEHSGTVVTMDIQNEALEKAQDRLSQILPASHYQRIQWIHQSHANLEEYIKLPHRSVKLIVYNLGYLPGGDKSITTKVSSTLQSIEAALPLLAPNGAISITCYPGHDEGKIEEEALLEFAAHLPRQQWECCHHRWINREKAPSLLNIYRKD